MHKSNCNKSSMGGIQIRQPLWGKESHFKNFIYLKFTEFFWGEGDAKLILNTMKNYKTKITSFVFKSCFHQKILLSYLDLSQELHSLKVEPRYPNERSLSFLSNIYFKGIRNLDYIPRERTVPSSNRETYSRSYSYKP